MYSVNARYSQSYEAAEFCAADVLCCEICGRGAERLIKIEDPAGEAAPLSGCLNCFLAEVESKSLETDGAA